MGYNSDVNNMNKHMTPLYYSVKNGHNNTANLLLSKGADVDIVDNKGDTFLHRAVSEEDERSIDILLSINANANIMTTDTGYL